MEDSCLEISGLVLSQSVDEPIRPSRKGGRCVEHRDHWPLFFNGVKLPMPLQAELFGLRFYSMDCNVILIGLLGPRRLIVAWKFVRVLDVYDRMLVAKDSTFLLFVNEFEGLGLDRV